MKRCDFIPLICGVCQCVILGIPFPLVAWWTARGRFLSQKKKQQKTPIIYKSWSMPTPEADRVFPGASEDWTRNSPLAEPKGDMGRNQKSLRIQK